MHHSYILENEHGYSYNLKPLCLSLGLSSSFSLCLSFSCIPMVCVHLKCVSSTGTAFIHHNMDKLTRIYPAGSRTDSSNYNPVPMWNTGCQIGTETLVNLSHRIIQTLKQQCGRVAPSTRYLSGFPWGPPTQDTGRCSTRCLFEFRQMVFAELMV